ncbi:pyridoxamine 5'-phosphate oxidase family protein [Streptomyces sp. NPDC000410]|uniref:pyridoxamine 5'-phosphate oxidase family protein n=1 Tax=Streptomyces sp. NPDC000410 TaxID=3154254 RepID=UPI0033164DBB
MPSDELHGLSLLTQVPHGSLAISLRAMPFVAPASHVVAGDGSVLLRVPAGLGCHEACGGSVVAYGAAAYGTDGSDGADGPGSGAHPLWSVQFTGTAELVEPGEAERKSFGGGADVHAADAAYLRIRPRFVTVHSLGRSDGHSEERPTHHVM